MPGSHALTGAVFVAKAIDRASDLEQRPLESVLAY
jgi:hypothetical protein